MGVQLHIYVVGATDVPKTDTFGLSDPYLRMELGSQNLQTTVKFKTLSPEWNEEFAFEVLSLSHDVLNMTLWDKDKVVDDKVSSFKIEVQRLPRGGIVDQWYQFVPFRGVPKGGRVRLILQLLPDSWTPWIPSVFGCKLLQVVVHEGRDIPKTDAMGWSDPYVKFGLANGPLQKTAVVKSTKEPKWEMRGEWLLCDPNEDALRLELWDANVVAADELVGTLEVRVTEWAQRETTQWHSMHPPKAGQAGGSLRVTGRIVEPEKL